MSHNIIKEENVFNELKKAVVETLRVDEGSIKPESSFINDLGAESLDFLDINYRLEQAFGIKMARHFVLEHIEEMFGEGSAIDEDGMLTAKAVDLLNMRFDHNSSDLEAGMDMDEVPALITMQSMTQGIMDILDSLPENCPNCGNSAWKSDDGLKTVCGSCGAEGAFSNGDDLIKEWLENIQKEKNIF